MELVRIVELEEQQREAIEGLSEGIGDRSQQRFFLFVGKNTSKKLVARGHVCERISGIRTETDTAEEENQRAKRPWVAKRNICRVRTAFF